MPRASNRWLHCWSLLAAATFACSRAPDAGSATPPKQAAAATAAVQPPGPTADAAPLQTRTLSPAAARAATATLTGSWQLVTWVMADAAKGELPAQARPATAASAEVWHFAESGRFRRIIGDDFAA
ncbi:MAG TPA: hypothetical protein DFR83_01270, partial [Deltaproteobacteria bacterium]|nr:hypothetical protein [Deltaproteobacteria bacterium]